jgi:NADH:ubiquinone oxidoreductase subunit 4 (subunit M)
VLLLSRTVTPNRLTTLKTTVKTSRREMQAFLLDIEFITVGNLAEYDLIVFYVLSLKIKQKGTK